MKQFILGILAAGVVAGFGMYIRHNRSQNASGSQPESVVQASDARANAQEPQALEPIASPTQPAQPAVQPSPRPEPPPAPASTARSATIATNPPLDAAALTRTVDMLVSPQAAYQQKRDIWKQLRAAGQLDQVITELEQRSTNEPRAAEVPAALGQAYLQKCGTTQDLREQGILAMQADKAFDSALTLDPSNWEARFTKAVALSYWPPMLNKGEEVIQHFQTLIQQQETQAPQPQFAEPYAWLGDQYQQAGRTDDARAVWQRGANLFPSDEKLRKKLTATPAPAQ